MDLHIVGAEPTAAEREAIDALLGPATSGWVGGARDAARDSRMSVGGWPVVRDVRDLLLPALHAAQDRVGWISRGALNYICRRLQVPPAEAWGVATFYHLLRTEPTPATVVHVCDDIACQLQGAEALCAALASAARRARLVMDRAPVAVPRAVRSRASGTGCPRGDRAFGRQPCAYQGCSGGDREPGTWNFAGTGHSDGRAEAWPHCH